MDIDTEISDFSAALLLRYFRNGISVHTTAPRLNRERDLEILKAHWAISQPVRALVSHLWTYPHETQSLISYQTRIDDAIARGSIDARSTVMHRLRSGLPTAIVAREPVRHFNTGPNFVLAWVLNEAAMLTARFLDIQDAASPYFPVFEAARLEISSVSKVNFLREPMRAASSGGRPGHDAVRMTARARQRLYHYALDAYRLYIGLEAGDNDAISEITRTTIIAPLEPWRRFELAVGLASGEALAAASGTLIEIGFLGVDSSIPLLKAGPFAIFWQQKTHYYVQPILEPSEALALSILKTYGMSAGSDRPDLIVVDQLTGTVVAVIEVKYLSGDTAPARFREAVDQVVRYARGYAPVDAQAVLLARSLVALSQDAPALIEKSYDSLTSIDFAGITQTQLSAWALRLFQASQS